MNSNNNIEEAGLNINNAFKLVRATHYEVEKLIKSLDETMDKNSYKAHTKDTFLRYSNDKIVWGWLYSAFLKIYKHEVYPKSLFTIEINFNDDNDVPKLLIGRHEYEDKKYVPIHFPPNEEGFYTGRRWRTEWMNINRKENFIISEPKKNIEKKQKHLKNLDKAVFISTELLSLNRENIDKKIKNLVDELNTEFSGNTPK